MGPLGGVLGTAGRTTAKASIKNLYKWATEVGRAPLVSKPDPSKTSLSKLDVTSLLEDIYRSEPRRFSPLKEGLSSPGKGFSVLQSRMPVDIDIPDPTNPAYSKIWDEPTTINNMSALLSALSKMPPVLFQKVNKVKFRPYGVAQGAYSPRTRSIKIEGLRDPRISSGSFEEHFPKLIAHEVTHSLVEDNLELYSKILDFLETIRWRFPVHFGVKRPISSHMWSTAQNAPENFTWMPGREVVPDTYRDLAQMMYHPYWPAKGLPQNLPPIIWDPARGQAVGATYAERHPVEDIAESGAYRILESYLSDFSKSSGHGRELARIKALQENVRYKPITELLKAAGLPLAWLTALLPARPTTQDQHY